MKKSILLLSGLGIGAAVVYTIGRGKNSKELTGSASEDSNGDGSSEAQLSSSKLTVADDVDESSKASMAPLDNGRQASGSEPNHKIDNQGTSPGEASQILRSIRDEAFDSSNEKLALALGRPTEEIAEEIDGIRSIDGDELMKARKLAIERGIEIQS